MTTENRSASSLHGQTGHVVGHGAMSAQVLGQPGFTTIFVVRVPDQWVVCKQDGLGDYDREGARKGLGAEIRSEQFAPAAQRGMPASGPKAVPFDQVQRIIEKSFPQMTFEWLTIEEED